MTKTLISFAIVGLLTSYSALGDPTGDCEGTPEEAVMSLPSAMDEWAQIICTPYGHIIAAEDGWIWSYPGAFSPVMVPSQMVRSNPEETGNASYFAKIDFVLAEAEKVEQVRAALYEGLDANEEPGTVYRLSVENQDGKPLRLYFEVTEDGQYTWGIWCTDDCDAASRFMVLDMRE